MSIIPTLIKGVKGASKLKSILIKAEKTDRRKPGNLGLNTKLKAIAYKFKNPYATTDEVADKFKLAHGSAGNYIKDAGLATPVVGLKKKTKDEIQQVIKGFKQYKKEFKKNPSKDQLSSYLGFEKVGGVSKISRLTDQIKKAGIKDPFKNLNFKLGTATKGGTYDPGQITRFKTEELRKFYSNPDIPKEVKQLRRDIDKTIRQWNQEFLYDKKVIDHIDSYWNAASKEVPYEDVANWQIIGKKINGIKAALYENPMAGLKQLTNKLKNAKGKEEKRVIQKLFNEQFTKHRKLVDDSEVILKLKGIDGIPNKFTRYADKNYKEFTGPMNHEKIIKQLDEMQEMINHNKGGYLADIPKELGETVLSAQKFGFNEGGRVGMQIGGSTPKATGTIGGGSGTGTIGGGPTNKVGTIQSMLAGIGAGLIDIPRGAFTLGAALMDLGLGTNKAAKVEQWFDDLTELDEMTEDNALGGMVRVLVNLGIPGAAAWRMGTQVTKKALLAKRNGNYFRITDPKLEERMKTALNAKGRLAATLGGAGAAGVSDAIFIGDPESVGTMGDLFGGGPTQLTPNDSTEASREVMNRIKFGLDGSLFLGVIGGTGSAVKSAIARRNDLASSNSTLDKFLSKLRPRGAKPQEFFELERRNIGLRAGDVNYAGEVARKLDKHIDAIFPFVKNPFNKMGNKGRAEFMDELNETLLSGKIEMDVTGKSAFGAMDPDRVAKITKMMKDRGAKQADIDGVLDSFEQMRLGWAHMFSRLGYSMKDADPKVLEEFKGIIGDKFKSYLGSTYEIFGNKSLIPLLNYAPTEEAVEKAVKLVQDSARSTGKKLTDEEARHFVDKMVESARLPRGIATSKEKTSGIFLEVPDFFANKTVLSDLEFNPKIALDSLTPEARKVIDEVLGKVSDPMQTMLAGSGRLSLITRRNQFYEELMKKSTDDIAAGNKGFFYETELDAFNALGGNIKRIDIDPSRTVEAGITNPLNGKYAEKGVAEAIEESAMLARDKGTVRQM